MINNKTLFAIFIILIYVATVYADKPSKDFTRGKVIFVQQQKKLDVEIAATEQQRSIGLMHRTSLALQQGMLFVFEDQGIQRVWMKNTLIPLDVLFISAQGQIVSIYHELQPCIKRLCDIYPSIRPAKYMLEINAGVVEKEKIKLGDKLVFIGTASQKVG